MAAESGQAADALKDAEKSVRHIVVENECNYCDIVR